VLLSIITVVKDDTEGFQRTLDSVTTQAMSTSAETGFEWLVIDGSTDESVVPALMSAADNPNTRYSWSAPQGVYPAMNTGLAQAAGDYVLFLNAGDELADPAIAETLITTLRRDRPLWLFGQVCFVSEDGRRVTPPPMDYARERASSFSRGRFPPHQGTIVKRQALIDNGGFDTSYRIAADYAACLRLIRQQDPVIIDATIANFHEGGLSTQSWRESMREFHRARRETLRPTGAAAVSEWLNTRIGIAKAAIYRRWLK
jgi:putative colanic acid biosynthesis glycosyltransferase